MALNTDPMVPEFEFRWVKRYVGFSAEAWTAYCKYMMDPEPPEPTETVLQFRMMEDPRGEKWWGPWQDVPTVDTTRKWKLPSGLRRTKKGRFQRQAPLTLLRRRS